MFTDALPVQRAALRYPLRSRANAVQTAVAGSLAQTLTGVKELRSPTGRTLAT
jgi:hypothetical protein